MKKHFLLSSFVVLFFGVLFFSSLNSFAQGNLLWATYCGGSGNETANSVVTDASNNVYITGQTESTANIASGGFQNTYGGNIDAFLVKYDASGNLLWGTYYGGIMGDVGNSVATDAAGNVYLAGYTSNPTGIATVGAFQTTYNGNADAFLVKFDASGNRLWATYFGGADIEYGWIVTTDPSGNVCLAGYTGSTTGIASPGAFQTAFSGGYDDAFLVKFDANGNRLWSTYYGGTADDAGKGLAIDGSGNVYLAGNTQSTTGIASGGFQNTMGSALDGFLVKFDPNGNRVWGTYYGGSGSDIAEACATDPTGNVFLSGWTSSTTGIASGGFQNSIGGGPPGTNDAYLVKFDATGNRLWATYYGGTSVEENGNVTTDPFGNVYLSGETYSANTGNCIAQNGFQNALIGAFQPFNIENTFLAKFDASGNRLCATYYGQQHEEYGIAAVDGSTGNVYLIAYTSSPSGIASGGFQNALGGGTDAYLAKFSPCTTPINVTAVPTNILCFGQCTGTGTATPSSGTNPYTYSWSPGGGTTSSVSGLCAGNYTVTVTDALSSSATATIAVTEPAAALTATVSVTSGACIGNSGTASITVAGGTPGYTYNWTSGQTTQSVTGLAAGNYSATVTDANGCSSIQSITVSSGSLTATATSSTLCAGQNAVLSATGGTNYFWSNGQTTSSINIIASATTTYSVIVTSGTCADTAFATLTVNPSPSVTVSGNILLCTGDVATLTAAGGGNYSWSNGSSATTIIVSPTSSSTYSVSSSNGTCADTAIVTVTVSPPPIAAAANATICSGQNATLIASGGGNYSWSNGGSTVAITVSPTSSSTYSVIVSIGTCSDTASATVSVNAGPVAFTSGNVTITAGNNTTLSASGGGTYLWSNGDIDSVITVSPSTTMMYCVTVSNGNCTDTSCVTVYVEQTDCSTAGELYLPNAFSPNGDGENDVLKIFYGNISCIKTYQLIIYNRWGEKVFETITPVAEWDGTYDGKIEDSALFTYYLKATLISGGDVIKKGNISLVR